MGQYKKFWYLLVAVLIGAFSILGYYGFEVYREAPPIPQQYVSESGEKVIRRSRYRPAIRKIPALIQMLWLPYGSGLLAWARSHSSWDFFHSR